MSKIRRTGYGGNVANDRRLKSVIAEPETAAEEWYKKSLEIDLRLKDKHGAAQTYHQLGMVAEEHRDFEQAEEWYRKGIALDPTFPRVYRRLGDLYYERNDFAHAYPNYIKASQLLPSDSQHK